MREILFRGKSRYSCEWVEGYFSMEVGGIPYIQWLEYDDKYHEEVVEECAVILDTVGQYTGLKDNNGTRIFEGDIIKSKQDGMIGVIRFGEYQTTNSGNGECHLGFSIEWYGKYSDLLRRDLGWRINLKIIGNICDNPELLKGEQKNETTT